MDTEALKREITAISAGNNESNDCVVRALTAATGYDYDYINNWMISRKYRRPRRPTAYRAEDKFLAEHNISYTEIQLPAKTIKSFQRLGLSGKYLIKVRRHILTVIDGKAIDWADMRKHRLLDVYWIN